MSPIRGHHIPESGTSCPRIGDTISHSSGHRFWTKVICAQSNCLGKSDLVLVRVNCFRNQVKLFVFRSRFEDHSKRTPNCAWFPDFLCYQQPEFFECIFKPRGNNWGNLSLLVGFIEKLKLRNQNTEMGLSSVMFFIQVMKRKCQSLCSVEMPTPLYLSPMFVKSVEYALVIVSRTVVVPHSSIFIESKSGR